MSFSVQTRFFGVPSVDDLTPPLLLSVEVLVLTGTAFFPAPVAACFVLAVLPPPVVTLPLPTGALVIPGLVGVGFFEAGLVGTAFFGGIAE